MAKLQKIRVTSTALNSMSLAGVVLASTIASGVLSQGLDDHDIIANPLPADDLSIPFQRESECKNDFVRAAHLESYSELFFVEEAGYNKHAVAAARILHDRGFADENDCAQVDLLNMNPFRQNIGVYNSLIDYDVVTISSYISWRALPQNEPPDSRPQDQPQDQSQDQPQNMSQDNPAAATVYDISDEFWDNVARSIVVLPATNQGALLYDAKTVVMTFMDRADTMITAGALASDNSVEEYSTNIAPDLVWYTGFSQGFCFPYYATQAEIGDMAQRFGMVQDGNDGEPAYNTHLLAGIPLCNLAGTSFVSPDIGGFMTQAVRNYPDLHEMEITVAAYLATSQNINGRDAGAFRFNGRGLPFDDVAAGHGAFMPDVFYQFLDRLSHFKSHEGIMDSSYTRYTAQTQLDEPGNLVRVTFDDFATSIRTIGDATFVIPEGTDPGFPVDAFPETITVYSPEGTQYDLPLRVREHNQSDNTVSAGFSVSAHLGENIAGDWYFEAPPGFDMVGASLSLVTADINFENSINYMIDFAKEWREDSPLAFAVPDSRPWQTDSQRIAAAAMPSPTSPPALPEITEPIDADTSPVLRPMKRPDYMIRGLD